MRPLHTLPDLVTRTRGTKLPVRGTTWKRTMVMIVGVLAFCLPTLKAATRVVAGHTYVLGKWSKPESISLPSESGKIRAERRVLSVSRQDTSPAEKIKLVLISSPSVDQALLSAECEGYVAISGKVAGVRANGGILEMILATIPTAGSVTENANAVLDPLLEDPRGASAENTVRWLLPTLFGSDRFLPKAGVKAAGDVFVIKTNSIRNGKIVLDLMTSTKRALQLTIDASFNAVGASENGVGLRLIRTGKHPTPLKYWSPPLEFPIAIPFGRGTVPGCRRFFDTAGTDGSPSVIAAWASDGSFWLGPSDCQLALFSQRIIGVKMEGISKVSLYPSQVKIPTDGAGVLAFEQKLGEFDAAAGVERIWETQTLDLRQLFLGSPLFKGTDIKMFSLKSEPRRLEIYLLTDDPRVRLVIALDTDLKPLSASMLNVRP